MADRQRVERPTRVDSSTFDWRIDTDVACRIGRRHRRSLANWTSFAVPCCVRANDHAHANANARAMAMDAFGRSPVRRSNYESRIRDGDRRYCCDHDHDDHCHHVCGDAATVEWQAVATSEKNDVISKTIFKNFSNPSSSPFI